MPTIYPHHPANIRLINPHKDLAEIADLIELCFQTQMDPDGLDYIRQVRIISKQPERIQWFPVKGEMFSYPLFGFVWEQDSKIVGNLTLIPIRYKSDWIFLIANVAVHPDYRRLKIAHHLTERAVTFARMHNIETLWLHVREDNQPAILLYQKFGFIEKDRRTTWVLQGKLNSLQTNSNVRLLKRPQGYWQQQLKLLNENYPEELRWNIPLRNSALQPGVVNWIKNTLIGFRPKHWIIEQNDSVIGSVSFEPSQYFADYLWLGFQPENHNGLLKDVLNCLSQDIRLTRPLQTNYTSNTAECEFIAAGFEKLHALLWMKTDISHY